MRIMRRFPPISAAAAGCLVIGASWTAAGAQGFALPPQKPVAAVPSNAWVPSASGSNVVASPSPQRTSHRADISFVRGQLAVKAENSSLNQILREIGRQTGIKVTGGVAEERVFGSYGPGSPADVLTKLLDGTGSNLLLIATEDASPGELVLTPRLGGVTPPNPNAPSFDDDSEDTGEQTPRVQPARGVTLFGPLPENQNQTPPPTGTAQLPASPVTSPNATDATTPAASGNQQSPNAVKTPLEIFQQLQQLRQQQQQQTPPPE